MVYGFELAMSAVQDAIQNAVRNKVKNAWFFSGDLKELGDQFRKAFISQGVSLIGTIQKDKPVVMCAVTDDLTKKINAGSIVKVVGEIMGGGGGGKSHIATAGGNDKNLLQAALKHGKEIIKSILSVN